MSEAPELRRPAAIPLTRAALSRASTDDIAEAAASAGGRSPRPTMLGGVRRWEKKVQEF